MITLNCFFLFEVALYSKVSWENKNGINRRLQNVAEELNLPQPPHEPKFQHQSSKACAQLPSGKDAKAVATETRSNDTSD